MIYTKCVPQKDKHYYHRMVLWSYIVWAEKPIQKGIQRRTLQK